MTEKIYLICPGCSALNRLPKEKALSHPSCGKCRLPLTFAPLQEVSPTGLRQALGLSPLPVVVDFWAPWCGPCKAFTPVLQAFAETHLDRALFLKINTEQYSEVQATYSIRALPTLLKWQQGREVARQQGALTPAQLQAFLSR